MKFKVGDLVKINDSSDYKNKLAIVTWVTSTYRMGNRDYIVDIINGPKGFFYYEKELKLYNKLKSFI